MKSRIIHVSETFGTGVGATVRAIAAATPQYDHVLIARDRPEIPGTVPHDGFSEVCVIDGGIDSFARRIRAETIRRNPALIHAHSSWAGLLTRLLRLRAPVIYSPHGMAYLAEVRGPAFRAAAWTAERLLARRTFAFLANGRDEYRRLRHLSKAYGSWAYFAGPDLGKFMDMSDAAEHKSDRVVALGRICSQKDPRFFAETANIVRESRPDVRFIWLGGPDKGQDGLAHEALLRKNQIEVSGWLSRDDVASRLAGSAALLHTARWEAGVPLSVVEAAAMGVPTIVRRTATTWDWASARFGRPEDLARQVLEVLNTERSLASDEGFRELARIELSDFSRKVAEFYSECIARLNWLESM